MNLTDSALKLDFDSEDIVTVENPLIDFDEQDPLNP